MLVLPGWDVISFIKHPAVVLPVFVTPTNRLVKQNALKLLADMTGALDLIIVSVINVTLLASGKECMADQVNVKRRRDPINLKHGMF